MEVELAPPVETAASDDALLARMARGDAEALRPLMARHGDAVLNVAYRVSGDRAAAEDVVQETFLGAFRKAGRYRPGESARPWLVTIARNLALKRRRRRRLEERVRAEERGRTPRPAPDPGAAAERGELAAAIERAVEQIDEPYRSALLLCSVEGLSYEDAAAAQRCRVKTLSSRLARARARFRELIAPYLRGAPRAEL